MQANHALLPLLRGRRASSDRVEVVGFLGSATILGKNVCTCAHVVQTVDFGKELILTKWNPHDPKQPWVEFPAAIIHPRYDFAVLQPSQRPQNPPLPLYEVELDLGPQVYGIGFHDDGTSISPEGRKDFQVAPRAFFGNVVRVYEQPNNKSLSVCELSFATLSGFSGAPLFTPGLDLIAGMIYGNVEQKIQVHERYELRDGNMEFSETVNRIMELGLFHSVKSIKRFLTDLSL